VLKFWNAPFFLFDSENELFKTEKEPKMKLFDFGAFQNLKKCFHMTKSSFTCFLGYFMLPPVLLGWIPGLGFFNIEIGAVSLVPIN